MAGLTFKPTIIITTGKFDWGRYGVQSGILVNINNSSLDTSFGCFFITTGSELIEFFSSLTVSKKSSMSNVGQWTTEKWIAIE